MRYVAPNGEEVEISISSDRRKCAQQHMWDAQCEICSSPGRVVVYFDDAKYGSPGTAVATVHRWLFEQGYRRVTLPFCAPPDVPTDFNAVASPSVTLMPTAADAAPATAE